MEVCVQIPKDDVDKAPEIKRLMEEAGNTFLKNVKINSGMDIAEYWKH